MNQYFNDSTGENSTGDKDFRGPWNSGGDWEFVEAPAFSKVRSKVEGTREPEAVPVGSR